MSREYLRLWYPCFCGGGTHYVAQSQSSVLRLEMRLKRTLAVLLVVGVLLSIIFFRGNLYSKSKRRTIKDHGRSVADSAWPRNTSQGVQTEVELAYSSTSTEVQTDTETTGAHATPKPVNPDVELTLIRNTSTAGEVRSCVTVRNIPLLEYRVKNQLSATTYYRTPICFT